MTPEYLSIWNIKRWCQSRLSGCHYPSRGDEAGAIRRQVAWRQTAGTGHQLHVTSSCCTSWRGILSHITQTYHHNPVTRRQVAWQPFMSSPHRTSRDPNTQQQAAGGWTGWIQIATGTQPPCFWVAHQPVVVLSTKHLMTAEYSEVCRCIHRPTCRAIPVCYFYVGVNVNISRLLLAGENIPCWSVSVSVGRVSCQECDIWDIFLSQPGHNMSHFR